MSTIPATNHSGSEISVRTTKGGRKLTYALTVIQQPERARACGAGAKSSADRRPVDPPPVVELRIFEGPEQKDITFGYSANFFLFATLEACKPVSHGRMPGAPPQQQPAVLTGLPVSGMAYLDRPTEAGYFIFPDLSVRHEGTYRLSFNLYEETKDECDLDADLSLDAKGSAGGLTGSMDWRLEIKSAPFTVFSAKKFPGLATSTTLSRTVAEQGCRVRIRRDVRLRRREDKTEGDYEEDEYSRARRTPSPGDSVHQVYTRQRSLSHSPPLLSADEIASKAHLQQQQYQQQHIQAYAPAPAPVPSSQALNPTHAQYAQQHSYPPAPMQHQQQRYAQPPPQNVPAAPQNYYYPQEYSRDPRRDQYDAQKAAYEKQAHVHAHDEYYRRSSVAYGPPPQAPPAQYNNYPPRRDSASIYPQSQQQYPPRTRTPVNQPNVNLAPLKMPPIEPKYDSLSSPAGPLSGSARMPAASQLPSPATYHERPGYGSYGASAAVPNTPDSARTGKRLFEQAFSTLASAYSQPLHNGLRPDHHSIVQEANFDDDEDAIDMAALKMSYKRADGHLQERALPTLH